MKYGRDKRLLTSRDYQAVFDNARHKVSNASLLLLATPNSLNHPRLGLVVAKKNVRRSVDRNRIKRVARETFRQHQNDIGPVDVIFLARRGIDRLEKTEQTRLLEESWRRLSRHVEKWGDK